MSSEKPEIFDFIVFENPRPQDGILSFACRQAGRSFDLGFSKQQARMKLPVIE
ncbi:MAG: hypothetical protein U5Q03_17045 [Bacteroidota bacterium]|nr:hypothetical protein [Bacteroidota bacterium]